MFLLGKRTLAVFFLSLGLALLAVKLRSIDWTSVAAVIGGMSTRSLVGAVALAIASYAVYCSYDLLGRHYTGHDLTRRQVLTAAFVSYACGLNLGPVGTGFRFRLYMRLGLGAGVTAALWMVTVATNWLGFLVLAGIAFAAELIPLPAGAPIGAATLPGFGVAMLAAATVYLTLCGLAANRSWTLRGRRIRLPTLSFAVLQCAASVLNWLLMASVIFILLQQKVAFSAVLGALLLNALALAVVDVPGGLGVLETIFVALLGDRLPATELLAALLAYRGIYYLAPLLIATPVYLALETGIGTARR
jgi:uncharacterized membrane protein YbhN (UPF0104 family)